MEQKIVMQSTDVKISSATRYGYGVASIADTIIIDFVSAFFLYFLTDIVGINPMMAGSVALAGVIWDAITDPIIGNLADRSRAPGGKYRRFILISVLPIVICSILLFLKVNFGSTATIIYYIIIAMLYYTAYTVFNIPYCALGSSLSSNEIEKTRLSGVRQSFGCAGMLFSGAIPAILIDYLQSSGFSNSASYTASAALLSLCSAATILITWRATRGHELDFESENKTEKRESLWKTLLSYFKCKSYILLIAAALFFFIGFTMVTNSIMYVTTGILGLSEGAASVIFTVLALSGIAQSFLLAKISEKIDKKIVYFASTLLAAFYMLFTKITGISSLLGFAIYTFMASFGICAFLVFIYNFLYDVVDIIEFQTNSRNSGTIFSYYSFIIKIGKAAALQLVGIMLALGGYQASLSVQDARGSEAILNAVTIWPAVMMIISAILIWIYPVSRKRMAALQGALALKRKGMPYSTEGFEKLL